MKKNGFKNNDGNRFSEEKNIFFASEVKRIFLKAN